MEFQEAANRGTSKRDSGTSDVIEGEPDMWEPSPVDCERETLLRATIAVETSGLVVVDQGLSSVNVRYNKINHALACRVT